jgi:broad specificity phosphatase PhoE
MTIYLVRHGATEWSESRRHTGRTDIPLTDVGRIQAATLAPVLARHSFARVLTSPLGRARETAALAGFPHAEVTPLLREVDYGEFEGLTRTEIRQRIPDWDFFAQGPVGGETIGEVADRARALIAQLSGDVLLFSHGHFLRIFAPVYLNEPATWGRHLRLDPASVSLLGEENDIASIVRWNDRHHLDQK